VCRAANSWGLGCARLGLLLGCLHSCRYLCCVASSPKSLFTLICKDSAWDPALRLLVPMLLRFSPVLLCATLCISLYTKNVTVLRRFAGAVASSLVRGRTRAWFAEHARLILQVSFSLNCLEPVWRLRRFTASRTARRATLLDSLGAEPLLSPPYLLLAPDTHLIFILYASSRRLVFPAPRATLFSRHRVLHVPPLPCGMWQIGGSWSCWPPPHSSSRAHVPTHASTLPSYWMARITLSPVFAFPKTEDLHELLYFV
jgi:hypothetical protein